jgi:hypothetical protein
VGFDVCADKIKEAREEIYYQHATEANVFFPEKNKKG